MKMLRLYVLAYPVVLPLGFLASWIAGRLSLGHWPQPSLDDPWLTGWWVQIPCCITGFLLVVGLPAFVLGNLGLIYRAYRSEPERRKLLILSASAVAGMVASICVIQWDPLGIIAWYMD